MIENIKNNYTLKTVDRSTSSFKTTKKKPYIPKVKGIIKINRFVHRNGQHNI